MRKTNAMRKKNFLIVIFTQLGDAMITSRTTCEPCSPSDHNGNSTNKLLEHTSAAVPAAPAPNFWGELVKILTELRHTH
jgi:hypothetical protein